jgi:hypothetical protein
LADLEHFVAWGEHDIVDWFTETLMPILAGRSAFETEQIINECLIATARTPGRCCGIPLARAPRKHTDIILLRTDRLNVMPMNNAVDAVVTSMGPQNVDTVLIAGKVMKRNGQLVGVDFGRLARLGDEARNRLYASANNTRI